MTFALQVPPAVPVCGFIAILGVWLRGDSRSIRARENPSLSMRRKGLFEWHGPRCPSRISEPFDEGQSGSTNFVP